MLRWLGPDSPLGAGFAGVLCALLTAGMAVLLTLALSLAIKWYFGLWF